ncbi:antimicrobial peptide NK-lysin [Carassius carassius]|uniref:antimicrobial peptide NK-lysin n=1 Tax=Carassius carassius TaxID=217509 RepID=UPI002868777A|nr:antimicrobial peptide NK-lysin [Carassius carassius]
MTKSLIFLLVTLLFCSGISDVQMGMSQHFDHLNPVREMELSYHDKATENKQLIICSVCKTILRKVIGYIGKTASKEKINQQLDKICEKIRIRGCKTFVQKYKNKLVTYLLSGDRAGTICIKLKMCKQMDIQTLQ